MPRCGTARVSLLCLLFLMFTTCNQLSKLSGSDPKGVLSKYLNASLRGQREDAYQHISARDQQVRTLAEYQSIEADNPFLQAFADKVSYVIQTVRIDGNTAKAEVEVTSPDFKKVFMGLMGSAFVSALSGTKDEDLEKRVQEKLTSQNVPMITGTETYELVKEAGAWKVFLDWESEIAKHERAEEIERLLAEADTLRDANQLQEARVKYDEILSLDATVIKAEEARRQVHEQIIKQAYIKDHVELRDFRTGSGSPKFSPRDTKPAVFGTIVNNGDRTLTKVKVTVYFLNEKSIVIGEKDFHPVLVTAYAFGNDNKPLHPNYMKDFGYIVQDSAPSAYAGKAWAEVTDIQFEQ